MLRTATQLASLVPWLLCLSASCFVPRRASAAGTRPLREGWPGHLYDNARTGSSPEHLATPLELKWVYKARHAPRHAWKEPRWEVQRVDFDYVYHATIADGKAFFGSSADHKVYALDLATGEERWSVFTGGPVRFAPVVGPAVRTAVGERRLFVASDDGFLYCLSAATGRELWRLRGGPRDERMVGNEQVISRWPARSGALVEGDVVYFTAGMWARDGVYVYALNAEDGSVIWRNDTCGTLYSSVPHSEGMAGVAPQGFLALHEGTLVVTTGRGSPALFDRNSGKLLAHRNGWSKLHTPGGSWAMAGPRRPGGKSAVFFERCITAGDRGVPTGEADFRREELGTGLLAIDPRTGDEVFATRDRSRGMLAGDTMLLYGGGPVMSVEVNGFFRVAPRYHRKEDGWPVRFRGVDYAKRLWPQTDVFPIAPAQFKRWETDVGRTYTLIQAGRTVFAGGRGTVTALAADTGTIIWQAEVNGQARGLAAAAGRLLVSTTEGHIYCFAGGRPGPARTVTTDLVQPVPSDAIRRRVTRILEDTGVREGCCLMLGVGDGRLAGELARRSALSISCLEPDRGKVERARRLLDAAGLYGVRVSVHRGSHERLPYADYFANLIVLDDSLVEDPRSCSAGELYRVLHPYDGVAHIAAGRAGAAAVRGWLLEAGVPAREISGEGEAVRVVRGEPPGAGSWTHQYADAGRSGASTDTIVRLPLRTLWFGGPGPARMVSRHFRGPPPLFSRGRLFVAGENHLIAVDGYNGRVIWRREFKGVGRYSTAWRGGSIAADDAHVYALQGLECLQLDARTGGTLRTYRVPVEREVVDRIAAQAASELRAAGKKDLAPDRLAVWEHLAVTKDLVLGSVGPPNERRMFRHDAFPEGKFVFALDKESGKARWIYAAEEAVNPNAIAVSEKQARVFLIDRTLTAGFVRSRRKSIPDEVRTRLKALDLATGEAVWETRELEENRRSLWMKGDVLIALPLPERSWSVERKKGPGGASAFSTRDGRRLWTKPNTFNRDHGYSRTPVLTSDIVYFDRAYDLGTGEPVLHENPVSGIPEPFEANAKHLCGTYSGSENLLMFRCGSLAFVDFRQNLGTQWHPEVRPGCWINMIAGGGMVLVPEGTSSCTCGYSYKTSLALAPTERHENWSLYLRRREGDRNAPVRHLRVNFGAVGDQRDERGALWMCFPRPTRWDNKRRVRRPARYVLDLPLEAGGSLQYYRRNADEWPIEGTDTPWLYTSGCEGALALKIDLRTPPADEAQRCRIVLHFAELEDVRPGPAPAGDPSRPRGRRVFDVTLDGKTLVSSLDVAKEAGGRNVALVKDLGEVEMTRKTTLRLVPRDPSQGGDPPDAGERPGPPIISALEIVRSED